MASSAEFCAQLTARHARTFVGASRFLPSAKRRAAFAVYAFCRVADDIVDECVTGADARARDELARHRRKLDTLLATGATHNEPVFEELAWAMAHFEIPANPFYDLLLALEADLVPTRYRTWTDLASYCGGVASTVGEMCAHVFELRPDDTAQALHHARTLGVALQLTNILRDVGEDAQRNRCYLPDSDLALFAIDRAEILQRTIQPADQRWQQLMQYEIKRARALYTESEPGLDLVSEDARCCAKICARGYAAILDAIEHRGYDSLTYRARVGALKKSTIVMRAWLDGFGSENFLRRATA